MMKTWFLLIFLVLAILANPLFTLGSQSQGQESVTNNSEKLADIEAYIAKCRERSERFYQDLLNELKLRANKKIQSIDTFEQSQLIRVAELRKRQYYEDYGVTLSEGLVSREEVHSVDSRIAKETKSILSDLEMEIQFMEKRKAYDLTVRIPYLEKQLRDDVLAPESEPSRGTVTGILITNNTQFALINHEIVKTGDILYGVKVSKIQSDIVEFEKNGKVWMQRTGESPENNDWQD